MVGKIPGILKNRSFFEVECEMLVVCVGLLYTFMYCLCVSLSPSMFCFVSFSWSSLRG